ncbi:Cdc6/Cdc18 family protein [Natronosalvus rutilus]|uniref:Orc1/cdc6 family replication initiation protein n=1 Tax=Natronosalvus rutilus TaxID=2953753 RepID=A0A9E7STN9_9EURY|nr:Cdc6/Cdc18 family protein [Natronosalvus rutilus]UTF52735.1 orc1/cdc6 family replication initiation protein [Natronosalvus rutilus]
MIVTDRLVRNREVLEDDTQPEDVLHRDGETDHLISLLSPLTAGGSASGAFIYGPPGTGKTVTARQIFDELHEEADVATAEVDCWSDHSRRRALLAILNGLDDATAINAENAAPGDLLHRIRNAVDGPAVVMFDEADQLEDFTVLRDVYQLPDVTMLLIANKEHSVFGNLEPGLHSRIGTMHRIKFDPYHDEQLVEILRERVRVGVHDGVVDDDHLEEIADAAARDARVAINILRVSLDLATAREEESLSEAIIDDAIPIAQRDIAKARVSAVTREQRQLLEALLEIEPAKIGEIYEVYEAEIGDKTKRTIGNWLRDKFPQYNLVQKDSSASPTEFELTQAARDVLK